MSEFVEGPDPENPEDTGIDPEKMDAFMEKVSDALRKVGLYANNFALIPQTEEEGAHKYGIHYADPDALIMMGAMGIGELAWKEPEADAMNVELLRMEQGIIESDVEDIRRKYGNGA